VFIVSLLDSVNVWNIQALWSSEMLASNDGYIVSQQRRPQSIQLIFKSTEKCLIKQKHNLYFASNIETIHKSK
jgi:hypothetical protein